MQVETELATVNPLKDTLLTIGVFDGIHRGHKYLIGELLKNARQENLLAGVITFRQHPREVLSPGSSPPQLTTPEQKVCLIKNEGVDVVVVLTFNRELAALSAGQFVTLLQKHLRMRGLKIGPDFALGKNREGDIDTLTRLGKEKGFTVVVVPPMTVQDEVVSSTAIRQALAQGDIKKVTRLLGHAFTLQGKVVTGDGRGTKLGFPTANLEVSPKQALPPGGVYATRARIKGKVYPSVTNIGWRPTFGGKERTIETYIIDFEGNLYDTELKIDIVDKLRDEKRFDSVEELKKQIEADVRQAQTLLDSRVKNQV